MSNPSDRPHEGDAREREAAAWVLRCDRGLSPEEQDEFSTWLAADPRNGAELARHRRHWRRLDVLAEWRPEHAAQPNPDLLAPPWRARVLRFAPLVLAAAAAVALGVFLYRPAAPLSAIKPVVAVQAPVAPTRAPMVLPDGTKVELNHGAELAVAFSAAERRVRLTTGEAHFFVEKDTARPFIVNAGGIEVRAVGTAFNVRLDPSAVEVLVTEGRVQVNDSAATVDPELTGQREPIALLEARQRAVVPLNQPQARPQTATLTAREIERVLAWQHRLLDFTDAPVSDIVAEFNRRNVTQLFVVDPALAATRLTVSFQSDNVDGFVRLLEAGFAVRAERRGDSEILLRKAK